MLEILFWFNNTAKGSYGKALIIPPILCFLKLGLNLRTGLNRYLTSWKSKDDSRTSNSTYRIVPNGYSQLILYMGQAPLWRAGSWTNQRLSGVPKMSLDYIFNVSYVNNQNEITVIYGITNPKVLSRMVVDESGVLERSTWHKHRWIQFWSAPKESCDKYKYYGSNGYCDF